MPIASGDKGVHTFPNDISPKVNKTARLEFELTHFEFPIQFFRHCATKSSPLTALLGTDSSRLSLHMKIFTFVNI